MPNIPKRWDGEGQWYFVSVVTKRRRPIFSDGINCRMLLDSFHEVHSFHHFRLAGLVILPNHWHGLIRPAVDEVIESVVGPVKKNFLKMYFGHAKGASIWQAKFLDRRIRDDRELVHYVEYIRTNPEKHQLVDSSGNWPWIFLHPDPFANRPGRNPALPLR